MKNVSPRGLAMFWVTVVAAPMAWFVVRLDDAGPPEFCVVLLLSPLLLTRLCLLVVCRVARLALDQWALTVWIYLASAIPSGLYVLHEHRDLDGAWPLMHWAACQVVSLPVALVAGLVGGVWRTRRARGPAGRVEPDGA